MGEGPGKGVVSTWNNNTDWVGANTTAKEGRFVKVVINSTEDSFDDYLSFGDESSPFSIFDVYVIERVRVLHILLKDYPIINDTLNGLIPILYKSFSDSLEVDENFIINRISNALLVDILIVNDSISQLLPVLYKLISDSIDTNDTVNGLIPLLYKSISDSIEVDDTLSSLIPILVPYISDSIDIDDSISTTMLIWTKLLQLITMLSVETINLESCVIETVNLDSFLSETTINLDSLEDIGI